jgi:hypothetical protein
VFIYIFNCTNYYYMYKYVCDICKFKSNIDKNYKQHLKTNKHIRLTSSEVSNIDRTCKFCEKVLATTKSKNRHLTKCRKNPNASHTKNPITQIVENKTEEKVTNILKNILEKQSNQQKKYGKQNKILTSAGLQPISIDKNVDSKNKKKDQELLSSDSENDGDDGNDADVEAEDIFAISGNNVIIVEDDNKVIVSKKNQKQHLEEQQSLLNFEKLFGFRKPLTPEDYKRREQQMKEKNEYLKKMKAICTEVSDFVKKEKIEEQKTIEYPDFSKIYDITESLSGRKMWKAIQELSQLQRPDDPFEIDTEKMDIKLKTDHASIEDLSEMLKIQEELVKMYLIRKRSKRKINPKLLTLPALYKGFPKFLHIEDYDNLLYDIRDYMKEITLTQREMEILITKIEYNRGDIIGLSRIYSTILRNKFMLKICENPMYTCYVTNRVEEKILYSKARECFSCQINLGGICILIEKLNKQIVDTYNFIIDFDKSEIELFAKHVLRINI